MVTDEPFRFKLTPAEARVAAHLPYHRTSTEIAHHLGVSAHTVRAQIAAVYRKVGAHCRTEAIELLKELRS